VKKALSALGHELNDTTIRRILLTLHYSLKPNKKNIEGISHPDRDLQFAQINSQCKLFEEKHNTILSIDCKKKEQIGNLKNNGKEWVKGGQSGREQENETEVACLRFQVTC
jgi:hypothetical protein